MTDYYYSKQFDDQSLEDKIADLKEIYKQVKAVVDEFPKGDFDDEDFLNDLANWAWDANEMMDDLKHVSYEVQNEIS